MIETAATLVTILVLGLVLTRSSISSGLDSSGVIWAVGAGVLWSGFTIGVYMMFAQAAPVAVSLTALRVLTVIVTAVIAMLVLGEQMSAVQLAGIGLAAIGVGLVTLGV